MKFSYSVFLPVCLVFVNTLLISFAQVVPRIFDGCTVTVRGKAWRLPGCIETTPPPIVTMDSPTAVQYMDPYSLYHDSRSEHDLLIDGIHTALAFTYKGSVSFKYYIILMLYEQSNINYVKFHSSCSRKMMFYIAMVKFFVINQYCCDFAARPCILCRKVFGFFLCSLTNQFPTI